MRPAWLLCDGTVLAAAEVCEGLADRSRGLLGRSSYDGAMLLPHTRSVHTVGMRFSMDVAFLDRELVVLRTVRLSPWRVALPRRGGRSVLEASAGSFERWGLRAGDRLESGDRLTATGSLVVVATPIGNLGDLSPRAVAALRDADVVCCEDTRRTRALLTASGVAGAGRLVAVHEHNEAARVPQVLGWLGDGRTVALVTDAGMPAVSDPGARLVAAAAGAGATVTVVPGPSAVLAALVVSGLPTDRFCMEGFLPRKGAERRRRLEALRAEERTAVLLEAPGRLAATLAELVDACGDRPVAVVRELTKVHEEVWRGGLAEAAGEFAARTVRGEVVVVLGGSTAAPPSTEQVAAAVAERVAAGDSARRAAESVAHSLGVSRHQAYEMAIALRSGADPLRTDGGGEGAPGVGPAGIGG